MMVCNRSAVVLLLAVWCSGAAAFYQGTDVITLDEASFNSRIRKGGVWMVEFYAPWCGHCQALKPAWQQAAKALKGIVNVAAVDCDEHKSIGAEYGVQGFPTIKFFYTSGGKIKSAEYRGGRSAKEVVAFAMDKARAYAFKQLGEKAPGGSSKGGKGGSKGGGDSGSCGGDGGAGAGAGSDDGFYRGSDVVTLTDGNFDEEVLQSDATWFVEFYAPWCGHCKALKSAWIDAASQTKGKVKFGAVDCTVHQATCGQFRVQGYPTIKLFGSNKEAPQDYAGGRDSGNLVAEANKAWAANAQPREVRELVDQAVMDSECLGLHDPGLEKSDAAQLCFIAFLPDILDSRAAGRKEYIDALKGLAGDYKDRNWAYLWAAGGSQPALEESLGVGGYGYPALVALKPADLKYSSMRSAFAPAALREFVRALRYEPVAPVAGGRLGEVASREPWDGQDAAVQLEDEFSLDDIMGDDEEGKTAES